MTKQTDNEILTNFDSFLSWYKSKMPNEVYLVKNKQRYEEIFDAISILRDCVLRVSPNARFEIRHGDMDATAIYFKVITDEVIFVDMQKTYATLLKGSNVEFYPSINPATKESQQNMTILFNAAYDIALAYEEVDKS